MNVAASVLEELARYDTPALNADATGSVAFPLDDEPHVERWQFYRTEAIDQGAIRALQRRFAQLRFPIRAGISTDPAYIRATLRGDLEAAAAWAPGLVLERPDLVTLEVATTAAGHLPVLVAETRNDFVSLVRALAERNEPAAVPDALGACLVSGLNNWDRINLQRESWHAHRADEEWRQLVAAKGRYQDRVLLLGQGRYAGVSAEAAELFEADWLAHSLVIRRTHEVTHYLTWRLAGGLRSHLLDELVADFAGLTTAFGKYRGDLALACLGLDDTGQLAPDGRANVYRQPSGLSDAAFAALMPIVVRAVRGIESIAHSSAARLQEPYGVARVSIELLGRTISDLARQA